MMGFNHISVLLEECIEGLNIRPEGIYVDGTLGGAGHSFEIARRLTKGWLIGFDQDEAAIAAAKKRLAPYGEKVHLIHSNFENLRSALEDLGVLRIDGLLLDLGVSSEQLDKAERGFSYMQDAPLDMRMDRGQALSAFEVVNTYSEEELRRIIRDYGEENWAAKIARVIADRRREREIRTTFELVELIRIAVPKKKRDEGVHPAKRTFQAIRIEVNRELEIIETAILDAFGLLAPGGRICVISFHSLEDRIVKRTYQKLTAGCICPKEFPVCVCGRLPQGKILTKKPLLASEEELRRNPRSRSAKLRILEKM